MFLRRFFKSGLPRYVAGEPVRLDKLPWYEISFSGSVLRFRDPPSTCDERTRFRYTQYKDARPFINTLKRSVYSYQDSESEGICFVYSSYWDIHLDSKASEPACHLRMFVDLLAPSRSDYRRYDNFFCPITAKRWLRDFYRRKLALRNSFMVAKLADGGLALDIDPEADRDNIVADDEPVVVDDISLGGRQASKVRIDDTEVAYVVAIGRRDLLRFSFDTKAGGNPMENSREPALQTVNTIIEAIVSSASIEFFEANSPRS